MFLFRYIKSVYIFVIIFSVFLKLELLSQAPVFQWGGGIGSNATDYANAVEYDFNGNVYTSGTFWNTADLDPGAGIFNVTGSGAGDIFITKLDVNGNFIWAKSIGGLLAQRGTAMKTDPGGNLFVTGYFYGATDFDPGTGTYNLSTSPGIWDAFILKLDPNGNFVWVKQIGTGSSGFTTSHDLVLDDAGNIYLTGEYSNTQDFDPGNGIFNLTSSGGSNGYVLKLDVNGTFLWAGYIPGWGKTVDVDKAGDIYVGGGFTTASDFDQGPGIFVLTPTYVNASGSQGDGFILKLNSGGLFIWVKQFSGTGRSQIERVKADCQGHLFASGSYLGDIDVDPGAAVVTFTGSNFMYASFFLKLTVGGNLIWANPMAYSLTYFDLDRFGDLYLTGEFENSMDFDASSSTANLTSSGVNDIYITKYSAAGIFYWATKIGAGSFDSGHMVRVDSLDNIYLTGTFTHTVNLNPFVGVSNASSHGTLQDVFVLKISQTLAPENLTASSDQSFCGSGATTLTVIGEDIVHWYTSPTSTTSIASGTNFVTPTLSSTTTYFIDRQSCKVGPRLAVTITVNPLPILTAASSKTLVCVNNSATLSASGASTYTWTHLTSNPAVITPTATKIYTVTGTDANTCVNTATVMVVFSNYQVKTLFTYPKACAKTETIISPVKQSGFDNGGSFSSGDLSVDAASGQINLSNLGLGTYVVNYSVTTQGCDGTGSDSINVVGPDLTVSSGQTIPLGSSITLTAGGASSYSWSPGSSLSCVNCSDPVARPLDATLYCVNAELHSCAARACVLINVTCETNNDFSVPNAFTPNGDGNNDSFCLQGWNTCVTDFQVIIFNRWGEKVFESSHPDFCWDGSYKGIALNSDVFIYAIQASFKQQANVSRKGNLSLIR